MDGMDRINSLVFDEYAFINQEIGPISTIEHDLFVADRNRIFSVDIQSAQAEFIHQATPLNELTYFPFAVFAVFAVQNTKPKQRHLLIEPD